jgi:hypothetical protein
MVLALNFTPTESTIGIPLKTPSSQVISSVESIEDSQPKDESLFRYGKRMSNQRPPTHLIFLLPKMVSGV